MGTSWGSDYYSMLPRSSSSIARRQRVALSDPRYPRGIFEVFFPPTTLLSLRARFIFLGKADRQRSLNLFFYCKTKSLLPPETSFHERRDSEEDTLVLRQPHHQVHPPPPPTTKWLYCKEDKFCTYKNALVVPFTLGVFLCAFPVWLRRLERSLEETREGLASARRDLAEAEASRDEAAAAGAAAGARLQTSEEQLLRVRREYDLLQAERSVWQVARSGIQEELAKVGWRGAEGSGTQQNTARNRRARSAHVA